MSATLLRPSSVRFEWWEPVADSSEQHSEGTAVLFVWLQKHVSPGMNSSLCLLLVSNFKLRLQPFYSGCASHRSAVILQTVLGLNLCHVNFVFISMFFWLLNYVISFSLRWTSVLVRNGNLVGSASERVLSKHVQALVGVNAEGDFNLWCATQCRLDSIEVDLTQKNVVRCPCTFAFEHLDLDFLNHGRLVLYHNRHVDNRVHGLHGYVPLLHDWNGLLCC